MKHASSLAGSSHSLRRSRSHNQPAAINLCIQDREGLEATEASDPKEPDTLEDTYRAYSSTAICV